MRPEGIGGGPRRPAATAAARVAFALAVALAAAATTAGCSPSVIIHGIDEKGANETVAALERAGIGAEKGADESDGALFTVKVARGESARALELLRSLGLPRDRRHGFAEVYGQPSLIPTASEERARYLEALGGEIERTLETADGVVNARVHLVLEESDPLALDPRPRTPARAAVLIKARAGRAPLPERDVQRLVAGSVPGLDPAAVAVVITRAPEPNDDGAAAVALATLGPLRVTAGSRPLLVAAIGVGLAVLALLAGLLLLTARRLALLQRQGAPRAEESRAP